MKRPLDRFFFFFVFFLLRPPDYVWVQNRVGPESQTRREDLCVCLNILGSTGDLGGGRGPDRPFPRAGSSHPQGRKAAEEQRPPRLEREEGDCGPGRTLPPEGPRALTGRPAEQGPASVGTRETLPSALRLRFGRTTPQVLPVPVGGGARTAGGSPGPRRSPG